MKRDSLTSPKTIGAQGFQKLVRPKIRKKTPLTQKKNPQSLAALGIHLEVTPGFEPGNQGFADPCLTTWLCHHLDIYIICDFFKKVYIYF